MCGRVCVKRERRENKSWWWACCRCLVRSGKESMYPFSPARWEEKSEREKKTAPAPTHTAYPCNLVGGNERLEAGGWDYQ